MMFFFFFFFFYLICIDIILKDIIRDSIALIKMEYERPKIVTHLKDFCSFSGFTFPSIAATPSALLPPLFHSPTLLFYHFPHRHPIMQDGRISLSS
jgi:hypothetical protein